MKRKLIIAAALLSSLSACTSSEELAPQHAASLQSVHSGDATFMEPRSLCELSVAAAAVGHFEVVSIASNLENRRGRTQPYVVITLQGTAFVGNDQLQFRSVGGEWPDGRVSAADAAFEIGEELIVFAEDKYRWPDGLWGTHPEGVLHKTPLGGYATDWLLGYDRLSVSEIERIVLDARSGECPRDIRPNVEIERLASEERDPPEPEAEHDVSPVPPDAGM